MHPDKVIAQGEWLFCKALKPAERSAGGLILAVDWDKDVRSEGVAQVISASPLAQKRGVHPQDKILYRGFLRYAEQVSDMVEGGEKERFFFLNVGDVLAVIEGHGSLGMHGEFVL